MRKIVLFALSFGLTLGAFAHKNGNRRPLVDSHPTPVLATHLANDLGKTSAVGDTFILDNIAPGDTPTIYLVGQNGRDSGYYFGTNVYGDKGHAERYDFNGADSTLKVLGVMAFFGGKFNPASTKTVNFYTWSVGPVDSSKPRLIFTGLPNLALDSVNVGITHLGIASSDTVGDTIKSHLFATPTNYLTSSFFVGYTINYNFNSLGGDTISVFTTRDGNRLSTPFTAVAGDTIYNDQNATLYGDGTGWHDDFADNFFVSIDYYMFPIVKVGGPSSVNGVKKNGLTFFGNYPNPASTSTNIKFSLQAGTDVRIVITNESGVAIRTIDRKGLQAGTHEVNVATDNLPAGNYIYMIRTGLGDGIASVFTVVR